MFRFYYDPIEKWQRIENMRVAAAANLVKRAAYILEVDHIPLLDQMFDRESVRNMIVAGELDDKVGDDLPVLQKGKVKKNNKGRTKKL